MKHANIPIFIPHLGCPNQCVFCNQRSISGHNGFDPSGVAREIETALATVGADTECEIAFFGGSFTGIDRELMVYLLETAQRYVDAGRVSSIRLSTRPDYIDDEILGILSRFAVKTVELGLQSMDDGVLAASRRGHDSQCARSAATLVKQYGFSLIGQMMIGLPRSDAEKEIFTAREICRMGADGARIYPTVVFYGTQLCDMARTGEYTPLDTREAVERTKNALDVFDSAGVPCIRVGLCASENLSDPSQVYGGATHSAIGELAMSALYLERICRALDGTNADLSGKRLTVYVKKGNVPKAVGQNRENKRIICEKYGFAEIKVLEKEDVLGYNIIPECSDAARRRKG